MFRDTYSDENRCSLGICYNLNERKKIQMQVKSASIFHHSTIFVLGELMHAIHFQKMKSIHVAECDFKNIIFTIILSLFILFYRYNYRHHKYAEFVLPDQRKLSRVTDMTVKMTSAVTSVVATIPIRIATFLPCTFWLLDSTPLIFDVAH